jgi:hypothetical protein
LDDASLLGREEFFPERLELLERIAYIGLGKTVCGGLCAKSGR